MAKLPVVPLHARRVVTSGKMINNASRLLLFKYIPNALEFHRERKKKTKKTCFSHLKSWMKT